MNLLSQHLSKRDIEFLPQTPKAQYRNGAVESLIKQFKKLFKTTMRNYLGDMTAARLLNLTLLMCHYLNCRPIAILPSNSSTPHEQMMLIPESLNMSYMYPDTDSEDIDIGLLKSNQKLQILHARLEDFKRQHKTYYWATMRKLYGWKPNEQLQPEIDDVVFVQELMNYSYYPKLAVIKELRGNDVVLAHRTTKGQLRTLVRPLRSIVLLVKKDTDKEIDIYGIHGQEDIIT